MKYKIHQDSTFDIHQFSVKMHGGFFSIFVNVFKFTALGFKQVYRDTSLWKSLAKISGKNVRIYFYGNTLNGNIVRLNSSSISKDHKGLY